MSVVKHGRRLVLSLTLLVLLPGCDRSSDAPQIQSLILDGYFYEAQRQARQLFAGREEAYGPHAVETADALDLLVHALARTEAVHAPETLVLAERAVELRERLGGTGTAGYAHSLAQLADVLDLLHRSDEASELLQQVLSLRESTLGRDHPDVGETLSLLGYIKLAAGDAKGAAADMDRAVAILEQSRTKRDQLRLCGALRNRSVMAQMDGDETRALADLDRALEIAERIGGPDHFVVGQLLVSRAYTEAAQDPASAVPGLERALRILGATAGAGHEQYAAALHRLAGAKRELGDNPEARRMLEQALEIRTRYWGERHRTIATTLSDLGWTLTFLEETDAAAEAYRRALDIETELYGADSVWISYTLSNYGALLMIVGDFTGARDAFIHARDNFQKAYGADNPNVAELNVNVAFAQSELGDYVAARATLERAVEIFDEVHGAGHPTHALAVNNLATVYEDMGDLPRAIELSENALASLGDTKHRILPALLTEMASLQRQIGDTAAAVVSLERALQFWTDSSSEPGTVFTMAEIDLTTGLIADHRFAEARTRLEALRDRHGGEWTSLEQARFHQALAISAHGSGDLALAGESFVRALESSKAVYGPTHLVVAKTLAHRARYEWSKGETSGALETALEVEALTGGEFREVARSLTEREALNFQTTRLDGLDTALSVLTIPGREASASTIARVWSSVAGSRAAVLDEIGSRHRQLVGEQRPELASLLRDLDHARNRLASLAFREDPEDDPADYSRRLETARAERDEAARALAEASREFRAIETGDVDLDEIRRALPADTTLVAYVKYGRLATGDHAAIAAGESEPHYLAFLLPAGARSPAVVGIGPADGIDTLVGRWRDAVGSYALEAGADPLSAYTAVASELRRAVWDPIASRVGDATSVFVVPDGSINLINLATLPVENGAYLVERGPTIHYLSAERDLIRRADRPAASHELLALGAPAFDSDEPRRDDREASTYRSPAALCEGLGRLRFDPLPETRKELLALESMWGEPEQAPTGRAVVLTGEQASESAFKRLAASARVVHAATHGFFVQDRCRSRRAVRGSGRSAGDAGARAVVLDNPLLLSGLALSGANRRGQLAEGAEDGMLTAEEIASLDLRAVEWVVLSACETGLGDVVEGEGVLGLRRAFAIAGAGTVIMSLWRVDDAATREWMIELYERRLAGATTPTALQQATRSVLSARREQGRSTHPHFWGAFIAAGDWR